MPSRGAIEREGAPVFHGRGRIRRPLAVVGLETLEQRSTRGAPENYLRKVC